ncbi:transposase [Paraburkholderia sp. LEh10]|uniref:Mu transposase C-terminal domain-containing protein n=1 Tax=Paraburkholderia sp. LEh10 TaxID=2821353 RepID=UPI001AE80C85|nr:Mu transposase C-terminal domain-containing protein [Paraburkholderia sp. LEh10]MBP0594982.1 transposase [Paraburkholderia sp. LEh10]
MRGKWQAQNVPAKKNGRRPANGHPGAPGIPEVKTLLRIAADWLLEDPHKRTYQDALDYIARFIADMWVVVTPDGPAALAGIDRRFQPTVPQLKYLIAKERPYAELRRARVGKKKYELTAREFHGRADQHVTGPGDAFVLDATVADIYLVSQFDRTLVVGRPTVYLAIDVFSRLIVGIYVGFEPPSWVAAMVLITNVVAPKVAFCEQFGISITEDLWPSHFLPKVFLGDKGEMMKIDAGKLIVENLLVDLENTASGRPDAKAIVETRFHTIQKKYSVFVPGYVEKDFNERGARDYRLDAALTLYEFTQVMVWASIQHNTAPLKDFPTPPDMIAQSMAPTPIALWKYGIAERSGVLKYKSIDEVRRWVLPRDTATITHKGIEFKGNFYTCPTAAQNGWYVRARKETWRVSVAYDPRDLGMIWLCEQDGFEKCTRYGTTSKNYQLDGKSLAEWVHLMQMNSGNISDSLDDHLLIRVQANEAIETIVKHAESAKNAIAAMKGLSKSKVSEIRNAHALERAAEQMGVAGPESDLAIGPEKRAKATPSEKARTPSQKRESTRESSPRRSSAHSGRRDSKLDKALKALNEIRQKC